MNFEKEIYTSSPQETEQVGREMALKISADPTLPRFIALFGDLGVGKTAFVRGFTQIFAPNAKVKSPTFALVNEYKPASKGDPSVFHFDMYRINDEDELYSIGFFDYLDRNGIALVEWSENIEYALPNERFTVTIEKCSQTELDMRRIVVKMLGA
jgi:tRNA threonylcarbamoyladenosine biosynthesis protein TsaE